MSFTDIPIRQNGQKFYHHWFNSLRTAGMAIDQYFGSSFLPETSISLANTQVGATEVTGLSFNSASVSSASIQCEIRRKTDTNELIANGVIKVFYRNLTALWEIIIELGGDDTGVTLSITAAGQIRYTTNTLAGSNYSGKFTYKAITFGV
jgi:hypothetical protein